MLDDWAYAHYFYGMKKTVFILLCLFTLICPLFAQDVSTLLAQAKVNGTAFRTVENSYQSSKNISLSGPEKISIQVSQSEPIDKFFNDVPDASLRVSLPEIGNDLFINMGLDSTTKDKVYTLAPSLDVTKKFDLSESGMNGASDLAKELKVELDHNKMLLQAENSFYDRVISIMQSEAQLKTSTKSIERSEADYQNNLALGQINPGSVNDLKMQQNLEASRSSLRSANLQLQLLKDSFFNTYGIEFETITEIPEYDLSFDSSIEFNTELYIARLNLLSAEKTYLESLGKGSTLSVSANAGGPTNFKDGKYDSKTWTFGAKTDLALSNFKASFSVKDTILNKKNTLELNSSASIHVGDFDFNVGLTKSYLPKPAKTEKAVLTIAGSWSTSKASDAASSNASIAYTNAQITLDNATLNFQTSMQTLLSDIASFNSEVEQFNIKKQYNQMILDYQTKFYELNYISQRDYQDAVDNVELDKINEIILALKGLKLENQIKMFSF